jgi:hypothetical protein
VSVNAVADTAWRDLIRIHLEEIAGEFANGNFEKPLMTHARTAAGADVRKRLAGEIRSAFKKAARGGVVRIETDDAAGRRAVHEFLRYQITEHSTGDPLTVR